MLPGPGPEHRSLPLFSGGRGHELSKIKSQRKNPYPGAIDQKRQFVCVCVCVVVEMYNIDNTRGTVILAAGALTVIVLLHTRSEAAHARTHTHTRTALK